MSITPGFKHKRRYMAVAIRRDGDVRGSDYIAAGATAYAIQTKGVTVDPLVTDQISRDLDDGLNGGQPVIHVNEMMTISGAVEVAGSGDANTPVAFAPLFEMAGHNVDTTTVGTEMSHNKILNASAEKDAAVQFHWEGMYHLLLAGKATLTTSGKIGELVYLNFEAKGIYGDTVEGAIPNGDFSAFTKPVHFSQANTSFTLDGQALNLVEFEEAMNIAIEYDEGTEVKQIFIDDWAAEGKLMIEAPTLATFDPFALLLSNAVLPYVFTHGTEAGGIFEQSSTGIQFLTVKPGEYKGKKMWDITYRVLRGHDTKYVTR